MKLTRELAHVAATDAANRNMRANGRIVWDDEDFAIAVATFNVLWPITAA